MRKIRFRIWDGTTYFYPEANRKASNHYLQFGSEGFWLYNSDGKLVASTTEEDICEQFTGLKDKNGKEIYEGDICELEIYFAGVSNEYYDQPSQHQKFTGVVRYMPSMGYYLKVEKGWDLDEDEEIKSFRKAKPITQCRTELIGNLHENPELLNTAQ